MDVTHAALSDGAVVRVSGLRRSLELNGAGGVIVGRTRATRSTLGGRPERYHVCVLREPDAAKVGAVAGRLITTPRGIHLAASAEIAEVQRLAGDIKALRPSNLSEVPLRRARLLLRAGASGRSAWFGRNRAVNGRWQHVEMSLFVDRAVCMPVAAPAAEDGAGTNDGSDSSDGPQTLWLGDAKAVVALGTKPTGSLDGGAAAVCFTMRAQGHGAGRAAGASSAAGTGRELQCSVDSRAEVVEWMLALERRATLLRCAPALARTPRAAVPTTSDSDAGSGAAVTQSLVPRKSASMIDTLHSAGAPQNVGSPVFGERYRKRSVEAAAAAEAVADAEVSSDAAHAAARAVRGALEEEVEWRRGAHAGASVVTEGTLGVGTPDTAGAGPARAFAAAGGAGDPVAGGGVAPVQSLPPPAALPRLASPPSGSGWLRRASTSAAAKTRSNSSVAARASAARAVPASAAQAGAEVARVRQLLRAAWQSQSVAEAERDTAAPPPLMGLAMQDSAPVYEVTFDSAANMPRGRLHVLGALSDADSGSGADWLLQQAGDMAAVWAAALDCSLNGGEGAATGVGVTDTELRNTGHANIATEGADGLLLAWPALDGARLVLRDGTAGAGLGSGRSGRGVDGEGARRASKTKRSSLSVLGIGGSRHTRRPVSPSQSLQGVLANQQRGEAGSAEWLMPAASQQAAVFTVEMRHVSAVAPAEAAASGAGAGGAASVGARMETVASDISEPLSLDSGSGVFTLGLSVACGAVGDVGSVEPTMPLEFDIRLQGDKASDHGRGVLVGRASTCVSATQLRQLDASGSDYGRRGDIEPLSRGERCLALDLVVTPALVSEEALLVRGEGSLAEALRRASDDLCMAQRDTADLSEGTAASPGSAVSAGVGATTFEGLYPCVTLAAGSVLRVTLQRCRSVAMPTAATFAALSRGYNLCASVVPPIETSQLVVRGGAKARLDGGDIVGPAGAAIHTAAVPAEGARQYQARLPAGSLRAPPHLPPTQTGTHMLCVREELSETVLAFAAAAHFLRWRACAHERQLGDFSARVAAFAGTGTSSATVEDEALLLGASGAVLRDAGVASPAVILQKAVAGARAARARAGLYASLAAVAESDAARRSAMTFRPSVLKGDRALAGVPINLRVALFSVLAGARSNESGGVDENSGNGNDVGASAVSHTHDFVTVGAFAAHCDKFKANRGLRKLQADVSKVKGELGQKIKVARTGSRRGSQLGDAARQASILWHRVAEMELHARTRLDVVASQAFATLTAVFCARLDVCLLALRAEKEESEGSVAHDGATMGATGGGQPQAQATWARAALHAMAKVGFLVCFESLLTPFRSELGMMDDHVSGCRFLRRVRIVIEALPSTVALTSTDASAGSRAGEGAAENPYSKGNYVPAGTTAPVLDSAPDAVQAARWGGVRGAWWARGAPQPLQHTIPPRPASWSVVTAGALDGIREEHEEEDDEEKEEGDDEEGGVLGSGANIHDDSKMDGQTLTNELNVMLAKTKALVDAKAEASVITRAQATKQRNASALARIAIEPFVPAVDTSGNGGRDTANEIDNDALLLVVRVEDSLFSLLPPELRGHDGEDGGVGGVKSGGDDGGDADGEARPRRSVVIDVHPALFTQGINEMQSIASSFGVGEHDLQHELNVEGLGVVQAYADRVTECCAEATVNSLRLAPIVARAGQPADVESAGASVSASAPLEGVLATLADAVQRDAQSGKNFSVLLAAADACHALAGGRVTSCKSAKDRTSMSLTLEQARLLAAYGLRADHTQPVANMMRDKGVRLDNVLHNVGKEAYAFNTFQRKMLPKVYRPPRSSIAGKAKVQS